MSLVLVLPGATIGAAFVFDVFAFVGGAGAFVFGVSTFLLGADTFVVDAGDFVGAFAFVSDTCAFDVDTCALVFGIGAFRAGDFVAFVAADESFVIFAVGCRFDILDSNFVGSSVFSKVDFAFVW